MLERERFPGFSLLPLSQQLDFIADALEHKFLHNNTLKLITLFTLVNHNRGGMMVNSTACGHSVLIKRLISRLKQIQEFSVKDGLSHFLSANIVEFQAISFHMLGLLSRASCGRDVIAAEGGLRLIIDEIKKTSDPKIFRFCCFALGNLVNSMIDDSERSFKQMIEKEKVIQVMLNTFQLHFDLWEVTQQICFAIGNLAYIGDFEGLILSQNGIQMVLEAMNKHALHLLMLTDAIFFLKNCAFGETGRKVILESGGIAPILDAMANHMENSELIELAINILFDLSFSGGVDVVMQNSRGIELILNALWVHKNDTNIFTEALRTLSRIYAKSSPEQKLLIIRSGAVETLLKLENPNTQKSIRNTLALFSRDRITHDKKPTSPFPSLPELCARAAINAKTEIPNNYLPAELRTYLKKCSTCSVCSRAYFDYCFELISYVKFADLRVALPKFWVVCSQDCYDKAKINL